MYEISFAPKALKTFLKLDNSVRERIGKKIEKLKKSPEFGKPLSGNLFRLRSLREGKFRILCKVEEDRLLIFVLEIGHRKGVY